MMWIELKIDINIPHEWLQVIKLMEKLKHIVITESIMWIQIIKIDSTVYDIRFLRDKNCRKLHHYKATIILFRTCTGRLKSRGLGREQH